jgi:hypothetical protein
MNKFIFEKILESSAENSEKIIQTIANIEDTEVQSHISEILVTDYEINSLEKCIEDLIIIYNKERLSNRKLEIIKMLEDKGIECDFLDAFEYINKILAKFIDDGYKLSTKYASTKLYLITNFINLFNSGNTSTRIFS